MKMKPRCVPCLLNRVLFESQLVTKDEKKLSFIMKNVVKKMAEIYSERKSSAEIATQIHGLTYQLLGNKDPYKELKERSNEIALNLVPKAKKFIENSKDKLEAAILCSIAGNSIDFGIAGSASKPEELEIKFDEFLKQGIHYNDLAEIKNYLKGEILYFTDNCGEIVFDKLVCQELKKYDTHLTLVCKKHPILTDATYEDVKKLGFDEVVDEIITTGKYAVGVDFNGISEKLKEKLRKASLIICKGMANYEAFSETNFKPIAYFLRIKCESIAESMGLKTGINVIKLYK
ncbi:MAG: hypothetical protein DRN11_03520 [Thermoplasmata archaeon]|nr:MAG: hypothetical protein DRN11_03520 [Thermoplasmata archaeon]